jgi:undecaprenyl-diphosphatase
MNAVLAYVEQSDLRVFGRLRGWNPPRWFRWWMLWATCLGDGWIWLATALVLVGAGPGSLRVFGAAALGAAMTNVVLVILKRCFRRKRPCKYVQGPQVEVTRLRYFSSDRFSFPSGHSMNAFAFGGVIGLAFPSLAPLALLLAASIAISRVVLGYHFVSDVIVGSLLGSLIGLLAFLVVLGP